MYIYIHIYICIYTYIYIYMCCIIMKYRTFIAGHGLEHRPRTLIFHIAKAPGDSSVESMRIVWRQCDFELGILEFELHQKCPPVVKHGNGNGPFISDFPSYQPLFMGDFPLPCLITRGYLFRQDLLLRTWTSMEKLNVVLSLPRPYWVSSETFMWVWT